MAAANSWEILPIDPAAGKLENFTKFVSSWESCKNPPKFDKNYLLTFLKNYDIIYM